MSNLSSSQSLSLLYRDINWPLWSRRLTKDRARQELYKGLPACPSVNLTILEPLETNRSIYQELSLCVAVEFVNAMNGKLFQQ